MAKCRYLTCVRVVGARADDGLCNPCRAREKYWDDKSITRRLRYRRRLDLSAETMANFVSDSELKQFVKREHVKEVKRG